MGLLTRSRLLRAGLCALALAGASLAAPPTAALQALPGPPLAGEAPGWGAACAAPRRTQGPWQATGFGAAVLMVGWIARRRETTEPARNGSPD